jgi:hypothetical protein
MTDKLPEWPFPVRPDCAHLSEWKLERQMALVAYWESRCRLAVEALQEVEARYFQALIKTEEATGTLVNEMVRPAALARQAIGPLPDKQP